MTNAEVVCVDGVHGVEAVVVRYTATCLWRTGKSIRNVETFWRRGRWSTVSCCL